MCFSNLWGLIENSLWSLNDARVVCTQLGYGAEGALGITNILCMYTLIVKLWSINDFAF